MSYSLYLGISTIVSSYVLTLLYLYPIQSAKIFYGAIGFFYGLILGIIVDILLEIIVFSFFTPILLAIFAYQIKKLLLSSFFFIFLSFISYSFLSYFFNHSILILLIGLITSIYVSYKIYGYYDLLVICSIGLFVGTQLHHLHFSKIPFINFWGDVIYSSNSNPFLLIGELRNAFVEYYTYLIEFQLSKTLLVIVTILVSLIFSRSQLYAFNKSKHLILKLLHVCLFVSIISLFIDNYYWSVIFALGYNFLLFPFFILTIYTFIRIIRISSTKYYRRIYDYKINIIVSVISSVLLIPYIGYTFDNIMMSNNNFINYAYTFTYLPFYLILIKVLIITILSYIIYDTMIKLQIR